MRPVGAAAASPLGPARDASNRSASRVARSAEIRSDSSSAVENGVYDAVPSSRIRDMSSVRRSSRSAGCFT